jgi:hypothetical protein
MIVKKFNYTHLQKRRNKIAAALLENYLNVVVDGSALYSIVGVVMDALPDAVVRSAVFDSVRLLAGTQLTRRFIKEFAWRLAGNVDRLIDGYPVLPWTRQVADEVVPVCVELVKPAKRKDEFGFTFHCRVLAGSPCPLLFQQFFSASSCRAIARVIGFSTNSWGEYQYAGMGLHFVNLMFFAHLDAEKSRTQPYFQRVSISSGMLKANRRLLEVRCRAKPCPQDFQWPCANCFVGYTECVHGVHKSTYARRHCSGCNSESYFDPDHPDVVCVNCARNR